MFASPLMTSPLMTPVKSMGSDRNVYFHGIEASELVLRLLIHAFKSLTAVRL